MEDSNMLSNSGNFGFVGRQPNVPQSNSGKTISPPYNMYHHHSASLDDLLIEEQPAWLEELLSEPASPKMSKGHRRSASDTAAYLNSMPFKEDGPSWRFQNINHHDDMWQFSNTNGTNIQRHMLRGGVNVVGASASKSAEKQGNKMKEGVNTKPEGPGSRTDSKRIKHQNAHRARLRRLEYISDLERTIQVLQVEGCEMSSAIQYLDQQLIMLSMENRALKQRMDSLAEIQKLKHVEQQLLEREIGNLHFRRQQQQQQPQQNQKQVPLIQQNRYNKYQSPVTQEPDSQFAALAI
ncbi:Basic leucine zipper 6 [Cardamine amara subsp. amara]|uniref:Basic leucine zipper 6 n=1 Tax=Cardamine amara subsp. amara TaxID=228776 RepID=A0ABD0ZQ40_CARAN